MTDLSLAPSPAGSVDPSPAVGTCFDTPGWTFDSVITDGPVGCGDFLVSCIDSGAKANCCKCKKECCGKCDASAGTDPFTCPLTLSPILQPVPRPTSPPSDDTVCPCTRYVTRRSPSGTSVTVPEDYAKSCPRELVPNWPEDCDQCCSYVSDAQKWAYLSLLVLVVFAAVVVLYRRKKQREKLETQEAGNNVITVVEARPVAVEPIAVEPIAVQEVPPR